MTKVGVVGTGGMGAVHANQYAKMPDVQVIAFDSDAERLAAYATRFGVETRSTFEQLVEDVDVVDLCLPTDLHVDYALRSIEARRPTLVEKPMARTVAECARMLEAAESANVPLMPAQVVRFFPEFASARAAVIRGDIGTPAAARTHRGGKAPAGFGNWFRDAERSGGVILDLAIHDFDWLRWTLGEPTLVFARSVSFSSPVKPEVGDYALATISFESGAVAHAEATWMDPSGFRTAYEVCGSGGMIEYDSRRASALRMVLPDRQTFEAPLLPTDDPYYQELSQFLHAIREGLPVPVTPYDGLRAVAIAEAAIESAMSGRPVVPAGR